MFHALTRLFRRRPDPAQLALELDAPPRDAAELLARLRALGLTAITGCRLTRNRTVMVSFRRGELRVHEGFLAAPPEVLRAIVAFVAARRKSERRAAETVILGWKVPRAAAPVRARERTHPDDETMVARLAAAHRDLNARHFGGALRPVPVRVSRRMRSRLGHYSAAAPGGEPPEIVISRTHVRRHGWTEAVHTLLHEMVHQWQDETGRPIDHGRAFRQKAREVGITAAARRPVGRPGASGRVQLTDDAAASR